MKIGILGGGQLGRMLLQAGANYVVETHVLENDEECPAGTFCNHFTRGDIRDFDTVYNFGKVLDAVTIEIESVNVEALEKLQQEGVKVYPNPSAIKIINNKILQKQFYDDHNIPTADFRITTKQDDLQNLKHFLPAVHKIGQGGYDGKGVQILHSENDLDKGFKGPAVLEKMINVKKEIALIVARGNDGNTTCFPAAEMIFDPALNLLDYQVSPADLESSILNKCKEVALKLVSAFNSPGIFAVELFVSENDEVIVNETAPRVHNSGHHTIEANYCSQYDMLWRIMLNYPLGNTEPIQPAAIVNLLGEDGYSGNAKYEGLDEVLKMQNTFVHLYGKSKTKPGRKMGHATILGNDKNILVKDAQKIKQILKVVS